MTVTLTHRVSPCNDLVPALSPEGFAEALGNHAAGVALVSADSVDGPVAAVTQRVIQVSSAPPIFAVSLERGQREEDAILLADSIVLHLLTIDQLALARRRTRGAAPAPWGRLFSGEPYVTSAPAWIRGEIIERVETGDSILLLARATHACYPPAQLTKSRHWPGPLARSRGEWHELGEESRRR